MRTKMRLKLKGVTYLPKKITFFNIFFSKYAFSGFIFDVLILVTIF